MEESSSFTFAPSFSRYSPTSGEGNLGNPMHRALTTSVSFGRFMSESLDWEKWSSFTQNKYLEDVEKYSRPGAVAEKKAYFEAHFKRRRAAALVEQQNASAGNEFSDSNADNMAVCSEGAPPNKGNPEINDLQNGGSSSSSDGIASDNENKRNDEDVSAATFLENNAIPVHLKRRSTSLHMSINFGSSSGIQRTASPSSATLESTSRAMKMKPPVKCSVSTKSNVNSKLSHHQSASLLPQEKKIATTTTQHGESNLHGIEDSKPQTSSVRYSRCSTKSGAYAKSPPSFSSFTFKTQERAEKRKEFFQKLEEKLRSKEAEKRQPMINSQAKTRCSYNDFCRTTPSSGSKSSSNLTKEVSAMKIENRSVFRVQSSLESRPPWRVTSKILQAAKNNEEKIHSEKRFSRRSMNENASPNIS